MRTARFVSALAATALAATAAIAAAPSDGDVTVTASGDTISVAGTLAEDLGVFTIGLDPADDAVGSGLGVDISEYAVSFPSLGKVAFHLTIGDANPVTGYFPQSIEFGITPSIGSETVALTAKAEVDGPLTLEAETCTPDPNTGVNNCSGSAVEGGYEDGVITWILPSSALAGTHINGGTAEVNPTVTTNTTGGLIFNGGLIDDMGINALAAIPAATLLVDGEAVATSRLSNAGYTLNAGGFAAGDHAVSVSLCVYEECTTLDLGTVTIEGAVS